MKPIKVLLIDDEKLIRSTTAMLLKLENIDTVTASDGNEGIALAQKEDPDIVLLDITMPAEDGWQVLDRIKSIPEIAHIPVVLFTADESLISREKVQQRGASAICGKPFHPSQLIRIIQDLGYDKSRL